MRFLTDLQPFARILGTVILATLFAGGEAFGQSLSLTKQGDTNFLVKATASASDPHTLQSTANLHLWIDVTNVQDTFTFPFGNAPSAQRFFRFPPTAPPAPPIRVLILGDSMASDCCGWGRSVYGYFKDNATVVNYALPFASTRVFLHSAEWDNMLLIKPDYVLMEYGFIDGATDPERSTPLDEYAANLRTIIQAIHGFNGVPILITLHAPRLWDAQGHVIPAWTERNAVTKQVAAELHAPVVDLYELSLKLFNQLGPSGTAFMHWEAGSPDDFMHFSVLGAQWISRLILNEVPDSLGPYLKGILEPPPNP